MIQVLHPHDQKKGAIADVEFEGAPYGAGVSFFLGKASAGQGPPPHRHPYPETCIVRAGRVLITLEETEVEASAGDIVVIAPGTLHGFRAVGSERLEMVCIHASERFVIEWPEHESR